MYICTCTLTGDPPLPRSQITSDSARRSLFSVCVCVCVFVCARARVRACACACVYASASACVYLGCVCVVRSVICVSLTPTGCIPA